VSRAEADIVERSYIIPPGAVSALLNWLRDGGIVFVVLCGILILALGMIVWIFIKSAVAQGVREGRLDKQRQTPPS